MHPAYLSKRLIPCMLVVATFSATHAHEDIAPCPEAATTLEIDDCLAEQLDVTEGKLETAYSFLTDRLTTADADSKQLGDVRQDIDEAQAAWRTFRRADCDAKYAIYGSGSIRNAVFLQCMIDHTEQRIRALNNYVPF